MNTNIAISAIDNIAELLQDHGGFLPCWDIGERLWNSAPEWKRKLKINIAKDPTKRNVSAAKKQIVQEVRRSLNGNKKHRIECDTTKRFHMFKLLNH